MNWFLFELKQEFIPANDFDDVKVRNRKKATQSISEIKAYLENIAIPE
jgi:hypothetical protein